MSVSAISREDAELLDRSDLAAAAVRTDWLERALEPRRAGKQIPPPDLDWEILLFRAGRGFGKSEALYQWLWWEMWRTGVPLIGHVIAPTTSDVRGTSFEGPVGLCSLVPAECLKDRSLEKAYNKSTHELRLANGSLIRGFSATEEGGRLRGPQCHALAGDELREWERPKGNLELAMSNALFGLRLPYPDGSPTRAVLGTTPRPIAFLKRFERRPGVRVVTGSSRENAHNLSASFRSQIFSQEGTLLGRQEIDGIYVDDESDISIVKRSWIKLWPADRKLPEFLFVVESYDTATSEENFDAKKQETDPSACVVLGVFNVNAAFPDPALRKRMGLRNKYAALLCECWSERMGLPELLEKARKQHRVKWGANEKRADVVLIEDKSSGPSMRQMLAKYGVPSWPYNPGRQNKAMRLHAAAPVLHQGGLFVVESARPDRKGLPRDWTEPMLEQLCAYAGEGSVEHDDYIDALSQAIAYLKDRGMLEATPEQEFVDPEEKKEKDQRDAVRQHRADRPRRNPYAA